MRTHMFARPVNLWIRLAVGLGLLALICVQCSQPTHLVNNGGFVRSAMADDTARPAVLSSSKLESMAKSDQAGLLKLCLENYNNTVRDYTCRFIKQERIRGKLGSPQEIDVKFKENPFSVAMRWRKNAPISDRALYVEGAHDGHMLVRPKGLLSIVGTVRRKPDSEEVMERTLRPITLFGFRRGLESIIEVYDRAAERKELKTSFYGRKNIDGRPTVVLMRELPERSDYPAAKTLIYIDQEYLVPVCIEAWDWNDQFQSRYVYKNIEFNVGLTDEDFKPKKNGL